MLSSLPRPAFSRQVSHCETTRRRHAAPHGHCIVRQAHVQGLAVQPGFPTQHIKREPGRARGRQVRCAAASSQQPQQQRVGNTPAAEPAASAPAAAPTDPVRRHLQNSAAACRRFGWISFWVQLVLSVVSAIIMVFSVAFTSQNSPSISLYLTLLGVVTGLLSTFWAFGYTRLSRRLYRYLADGPAAKGRRVRRIDVLNTLERGVWINCLGLGSTLLGLQATVGLLVAKTLTNATANPFLAGGQGAYNPVLALDVFLVQASTNTLLSHFVSLMIGLWLMRLISRPPADQPAAYSLKPAAG